MSGNDGPGEGLHVHFFFFASQGRYTSPGHPSCSVVARAPRILDFGLFSFSIGQG